MHSNYMETVPCSESTTTPQPNSLLLRLSPINRNKEKLTPRLCFAGPFQPVKDPQDGYQFVYPFGWQEVSVRGQDVVYKDVIEPLESVSVSIVKTDKTSISDYGSPGEVWTDLIPLHTKQ